MNTKRFFAGLLFVVGIGYLIFSIFSGFTVIDFVLTLLLVGNGAVILVADFHARQEAAEEAERQAALAAEREDD